MTGQRAKVCMAERSSILFMKWVRNTVAYTIWKSIRWQLFMKTQKVLLNHSCFQHSSHNKLVVAALSVTMHHLDRVSYHNFESKLLTLTENIGRDQYVEVCALRMLVHKWPVLGHHSHQFFSDHSKHIILTGFRHLALWLLHAVVIKI